MTHTRTHVITWFASSFEVCDPASDEGCGQHVVGYHRPEDCGPGCDLGSVNWPCRHKAATRSVCPSWGPVDGCTCAPPCPPPR